MLETLLKLYVAAMLGDVRSPTPHLFGPPGCGKSTTVEKLAELVGKKLHVINVSRLSPLELEGVQMPVEDNTRLHMIPAVFWSRLEEGDIILFDEFLRGFPEVYNGLLDIFTSRQVGAFKMPKVFIIAASNSTVAYDKALEDRLLHITVDDPRHNKRAKNEMAQILCKELGLLPGTASTYEMQSLLDSEVLPMFDILDQLKNRSSGAPVSLKGCSIRNLIGQAQLRNITSTALHELIDSNNRIAIQQGKYQYVLLPSGKNADSRYVNAARQLQGNPKLTPIQATNLDLNLQLVQMEAVRNEKETEDDDTFLNDLS